MNDRVLEADDTSLVEADDWSRIEPKAAPLSASAELQRQIDEFLAHGGKVREVAPGATGIPDARAAWGFVTITPNSTPDAKKQAMGEARRRAIGVNRNGNEPDSVLVVKMNLALGAVSTGKELSAQVGVSSSVIYRLCAQYFPDDKRADRFRGGSMEDRLARTESRVLPLLKEAIEEGVVGVIRLATVCGVGSEMLHTIAKKHKIDLPAQPSGRRGTTPAEGRQKRTYQGKEVCQNAECGARIVVTCHYCPNCGQITPKGIEKGAEQ